MNGTLRPSTAETSAIARASSDPKEPATGLVLETVDALRQLVRIEVALAREELDQQVAMAKSAAVPLAAGIAAAITAVTLLLAALALALPVPWLAAAIGGAVLLALAVALLARGLRKLPKRPLPKTTDRLVDDVAKVKERMA